MSPVTSRSSDARLASSAGDDLAACFNGTKLHGDDFSQERILEWYREEEDGYASLKRDKPYTYGYHELNDRYAWRWLPQQRFESALGLGSAFGHEFIPIANRLGSITLVDVNEDFRRDSLEGVPVRYVKAQASGTLSFDDATFDLAVCLATLHHIPNVSHVVREIARCLKPGGFACLREPIVSMGDWRKPRGSLTKNERGIPLRIFDEIVRSAGLEVRRRNVFMFQPWRKLWNAVARGSLTSSPFAMAVDEWLSKAFLWNYRYHARSALQHFRPVVAAYVLQRPPAR